MKKIIIVLAFLLVSTVFPKDSGWQIETVDQSGQGACSISLALDSMDYPHIVHYTYTDENLRYLYYDGSTWQYSDVDTLGMVGFNCSLALDSFDRPHISYINVDDKELRYAYFNGSDWEISNVDSLGYVDDWSSSIAIDSADHPHISYKQSTTDSLKYAYFDGSTWWLDTVDQDFCGDDSYIVVDSNDHPHISYVKNGFDLGYAFNDGYGWEISTADFSCGGYGNSIEVDSKNLPHIAYHDSYGVLKYAHLDAGDWVSSDIDTGEDEASSPSIALDSLDRPSISYYDNTNQDLRYIRFDGSTWNLSIVDDDLAVGHGSSLALDKSDCPHIAYFDAPWGTIKYAYYYIETKASLLSFTAQAQGRNAIKLRWQIAPSDTTEIVGFNLYRSDATKAHKKDWARLNSSPITGNNPYQFVDTSVRAGQGYHYRLFALTADGKEEMLGTTQGEASTTPAVFALTAVYPNPASSLLTCRLTMPQAGSVSLGLYDISGRLVLSQRMELAGGEQETTLAVGNLAKGIYTVRASSGVESATKRVVVMR